LQALKLHLPSQFLEVVIIQQSVRATLQTGKSKQGRQSHLGKIGSAPKISGAMGFNVITLALIYGPKPLPFLLNQLLRRFAQSLGLSSLAPLILGS